MENNGLLEASYYSPRQRERWDIFGEKHPGKVSSLKDGHSWARYQGEYSVDNFTTNFYDEPEPLPG